MTIGDDALKTLLSFRQLELDQDEGGGMLLGRLLKDTGDVVVDRVTEPGPHDRCSRFRFFRARRPAQRLVDDLWHKSRGTGNYLGEWHSHPEDIPEPSPQDRDEWKRTARDALYEQGSLLFVIVARDGIGMWEYDPEWDEPVKLERK